MIVSLSYEVEVTFHDDDVWRRCVENHGNWRGMFYELTTKEEVAAHLAHNFIANNAIVSQLDGWGDVPESAVTIRTVSLLHTVEEGQE